MHIEMKFWTQLFSLSQFFFTIYTTIYKEIKPSLLLCMKEKAGKNCKNENWWLFNLSEIF